MYDILHRGTLRTFNVRDGGSREDRTGTDNVPIGETVSTQLGGVDIPYHRDGYSSYLGDTVPSWYYPLGSVS